MLVLHRPLTERIKYIIWILSVKDILGIQSHSHFHGHSKRKQLFILVSFRDTIKYVVP